MARRYRRESCRALFWWVVVVVAGVLDAADGHPGLQHLALGLGLIATASLPVAWIGRWRIRADGDGLDRRTLWGRDRWPWSAFESGLVRHGPDAFSFHWPGRRGGPRSLRIGRMDVSERELLYDLIGRRWNLPPAPEVPERMAFVAPMARLLTLGPDGQPQDLGRRRRLRISLGPEGLGLSSGWLPVSWSPSSGRITSWRHVRALHLTRASHDRRDFLGLSIVLSDRAIKLWASDLRGRRGHSPDVPGREAPVGLLRRHVPEDRIAVLAEYGPPADAEERAARIADLEEFPDMIRVARWRLLPLLVPLMLVMSGLLAATRGPEAAASGAMAWLVLIVATLAALRICEGRALDLRASWTGP
jgi:hypothetical protein